MSSVLGSGTLGGAPLGGRLGEVPVRSSTTCAQEDLAALMPLRLFPDERVSGLSELLALAEEQITGIAGIRTLADERSETILQQKNLGLEKLASVAGTVFGPSEELLTILVGSGIWDELLFGSREQFGHGNELLFSTQKEFGHGDELLFSTQKQFGQGVEDSSGLAEYFLSQKENSVGTGIVLQAQVERLMQTIGQHILTDSSLLGLSLKGMFPVAFIQAIGLSSVGLLEQLGQSVALNVAASENLIRCISTGTVTDEINRMLSGLFVLGQEARYLFILHYPMTALFSIQRGVDGTFRVDLVKKSTIQ